MNQKINILKELQSVNTYFCKKQKTGYLKKQQYAPPSEWKNSKETVLHQRYVDVYDVFKHGTLKTVVSLKEGNFSIITENNSRIEIAFWKEDICRVQHIHPYPANTCDYALKTGIRASSIPVIVEENVDYIILKSPKITCKILKSNCCIEFKNTISKQSILKEAQPYTQRSSINKGVDQVKISFECTSDDYFFGLGDKSCSLNLKGKYFQNWNTDAFAYSKDKDPLYRSIPFYYGVANEQAYGVFLNNSWKSHFDFNSNKNNEITIWADGGQMDYFFLSGPSLENVSTSYHYLTGTPELPPLWLLGFHQCRWSYYPQDRVTEIARKFRAEKIPCDAIYLDIDYMDEYRCFSWNKNHFPHPTEMIKELKDQGMQTVVMIDPGIKVDEQYDVFQSGLKENVFCRRTNGALMQGPVWPSSCVWPDYTHKKTRAWWGKQYEKLYLDNGISGFWNDMNEPAMFKVKQMTFPDTVLHDNDGQKGDHRQAHNIYGQQMSRATAEGLKTLNPNKRPFVLTRATFSGGQRYAAVWTGDNIASWEHLRLANRQCQRLSISGFSLVGTDIGGFVDQPEPSLFIRWLQLSIFHPIFRTHSMGNNADGSGETDSASVEKAAKINRFDREPWALGEPYTTQAKNAIEFRYRLLPYLYTSIYRHTLTGIPLIRSLSFEDMNDQRCLKRENEFLIGTHLLISPVTKKGVKTHSTYLPKGKWLDFHTGKLYFGQRFIRKKINENSIPIYVRSGAVIPQYPVQQYVNELDITNVQLNIYFGIQETVSYFYQDKGEGYAYQNGIFRLHQFTTSSSATSFIINQTREGTPQDNLSSFDIKLCGFPFSSFELFIDDVYIKNCHEKTITIPANFKKTELKPIIK